MQRSQSHSVANILAIRGVQPPWKYQQRQHLAHRSVHLWERRLLLASGLSMHLLDILSTSTSALVPGGFNEVGISADAEPSMP